MIGTFNVTVNLQFSFLQCNYQQRIHLIQKENILLKVQELMQIILMIVLRLPSLSEDVERKQHQQALVFVKMQQAG